jgi:hypothetical protein
MAPRRKYPILADAVALRACLEALSPEEVAQEIGCSLNSVRSAAKALGLSGLMRTWAARRRRMGKGHRYQRDPFDRLEGQRRQAAARQATRTAATPYGPRPLARIGRGQLSPAAEAAAFAASGLGRRTKPRAETVDETEGDQ